MILCLILVFVFHFLFYLGFCRSFAVKMHIQVVKTVDYHNHTKYCGNDREGHKVRRNERKGSSGKEEPIVVVRIRIVAKVGRVVGEVSDRCPRCNKTYADK